MPTATNKQRLLNHLFSAVKKSAGAGETEARPVLEQFIYALCRQGTTRGRADKAYAKLRKDFFDWNEVRVSSSRELEETMGDVPQAEARAQRLISFLQEVFETNFSFDLEDLQKKGVKVAAKQLARYQAADDYVVAWVIQHSLGGHAIPVDEPMLRALRRLGMIDEDQENLEAIRASLEHLIPKAKGTLFVDVVSDLANEVCHEEPHCGSCPMHADCPIGMERVRTIKPKPR
jgi:endonuclease-3